MYVLKVRLEVMTIPLCKKLVKTSPTEDNRSFNAMMRTKISLGLNIDTTTYVTSGVMFQRFRILKVMRFKLCFWVLIWRQFHWKWAKKEAFVLEFINRNNFILAELWQLQCKWLGSFSKDRINVWAKVGICARRSEYFREQSWKLSWSHPLFTLNCRTDKR